ncbi:MAG: hypothetical protein ACRDNH_13000 [Gaiellaceae bacterium]
MRPALAGLRRVPVDLCVEQGEERLQIRNRRLGRPGAGEAHPALEQLDSRSGGELGGRSGRASTRERPPDDTPARAPFQVDEVAGDGLGRLLVELGLLVLAQPEALSSKPGV